MAHGGPRSSLLWFCALSCCSLAVQSQNLLVNGGFEFPEITTSGPLNGNLKTGLGIPGWSITQGNVDLYNKNLLQDAAYYPAAEDNQALNLNGLESGSIAQTFSTVANNVYQVSFKMTGNTSPVCQSGDPLKFNLKVNIRSVDLTSTLITPDRLLDVSVPANTPIPEAAAYFTTFFFTFTAEEDITTIEFVSLTPGCGGPIIDAIEVILFSSSPSNCFPSSPIQPPPPPNTCPNGLKNMTTSGGCSICIEDVC
eukprot:TRINITY_DN19186_c0_g1_i1.p1 TRINITY_DN19186_c0_g1~~TRINITY_DN19186_c0_g1_i1.p1  ORF type:complete len:253 (+),score=21.41 TRINITY_DN19186_c0_g1_i1:209-967(+)